MFGLTSNDLEMITEVLTLHPEIQEGIIFGSRALERHKKGSDVDIALKGELRKETVTDIFAILNERSPLPYFFDILDYSTIGNLELKDHIDRVGKTFYLK